MKNNYIYNICTVAKLKAIQELHYFFFFFLIIILQTPDTYCLQKIYVTFIKLIRIYIFFLNSLIYIVFHSFIYELYESYKVCQKNIFFNFLFLKES